jgi:putative phosphoesterase
MIIGVISDAHGNEVALRSCISHLKKKVDQIYFLGDICGYLSDVNGCIDLLRLNNVICVMGNHDAMLLGKLPLDVTKDSIYQLAKSRSIISNANKKFLEVLPERIDIEIDNVKVAFVHGSPNNYLEEYLYPDTNLDMFSKCNFDVLFCGHTHRPFVRNSGHKKIVNVGSCGLPRDIGNSFSMAIFDSQTNSILIERITLSLDVLLSTYDKAHKSVKECFKRNSL